MSFTMIVYWISMLDPLNQALLGAVISSGLVLGLAMFIYLGNYGDAQKEDVEKGPSQYSKGESYAPARAALLQCVKAMRHSVRWLVIFTILLVATPSKDTAYVMVAGYGLDTVVSSERAKQLGGKSLDVIEQWLDELAPKQLTDEQ